MMLSDVIFDPVAVLIENIVVKPESRPLSAKLVASKLISNLLDIPPFKSHAIEFQIKGGAVSTANAEYVNGLIFRLTNDSHKFFHLGARRFLNDTGLHVKPLHTDTLGELLVLVPRVGAQTN
jgi:hypothetical protein